VKRAVLLISAAAALALPSAARAEAQPPLDAAPTADAATASPPARRRPEITLATGLRLMFLPGAGFDPYASGSDVMAMSSLSAGMTLFRAGKTSVIASAEWDVGSRSDSARGQDASLTLHRLAGGLETRWRPVRRLSLFVKLAPAAFKVLGSIQSPANDTPLVARPWTWGLDTTGGAGLVMVDGASVKLWLAGEAGYAFAGSVSMSYAPAASDADPRMFGSVMLPAFRPAGVVSRLAVALSF
jgi:hypothetical protein